MKSNEWRTPSVAFVMYFPVVSCGVWQSTRATREREEGDTYFFTLFTSRCTFSTSFAIASWSMRKYE